MSQPRHKHFLQGVYVTCGLLLCAAIFYIVDMVISYDGMCGGFFTGLSAREPCSFWQYATGEMPAIAMVVATPLWPLVLMVLILPSLAGYIIDRRRSRRVD